MSPETDITLVVLPFANTGGDPARDYFAEGITDYLSGALLGVPGLRVASRGLAAAYKGRPIAPARLAAELQVDAVLEGSARRSASQTSVAARLSRAETDRPLWSRTFDTPLDGVLGALPQIVLHAAEALGRPVGDDARSALAQGLPANFDAFDAFLRGRQVCGQVRRRSQEFARDMFSDAATADSRYALAHAGIADCHSLLFNYWDSSAENVRLADEASARAIAAGPLVAEAHVSRGLALSVAKRYDAAADEFSRALELKPDLYEAHYYFARSQRSAGRLKEAADRFERACALRPEDYATPALLASVYVSLERGADAKAAQQRALQLAERHLELDPDDSRALYLGAGALAQVGDPAKARQWAKRALAMDPDDSAVLYNVACAYALLGLTDSAIDCLEQALANGFGHWEWITHDSDLDSLRHHPRFQALADKRG